jgi:hypothetical protein
MSLSQRPTSQAGALQMPTQPQQHQKQQQQQQQVVAEAQAGQQLVGRRLTPPCTAHPLAGAPLSQTGVYIMPCTSSAAAATASGAC